MAIQSTEHRWSQLHHNSDCLWRERQPLKGKPPAVPLLFWQTDAWGRNMHLWKHASMETLCVWKLNCLAKTELSSQNALHRCCLKHAEVHVQGTNKSIDKLVNGVPGGPVHTHSFILSRGKERVNTDCQGRVLMIIRVFLWVATALLEHRKWNQSDPWLTGSLDLTWPAC